MKFNTLFSFSFALALGLSSTLIAKEESTKVDRKVKTNAKAAKTEDKKDKDLGSDVGMEFFDAIDEGKIKVEFLPKNATKATVVIHNKTDAPVQIRLPDTFAAVPHEALAQMGGMGGGMGGMGGGGMGGGGGAQGMGGGMGGGGMGGGMGGMGGGMGGMMNIEPDNPRKIQTQTVCLEFGKKDPNPRIKYEIIRLEKLNKDPEVAKICSALGNNELPQTVAQAAAWHVANGLTWDRLETLPKVVSQYTGIEFYFTQYEVATAKTAVNYIRAQSDDSSSSSYKKDEDTTSYSDSAAARNDN